MFRYPWEQLRHRQGGLPKDSEEFHLVLSSITMMACMPKLTTLAYQPTECLCSHCSLDWATRQTPDRILTTRLAFSHIQNDCIGSKWFQKASSGARMIDTQGTLVMRSWMLILDQMTQKAADDILKNRIVFGLFIGEPFLYQLVVYPISLQDEFLRLLSSCRLVRRKQPIQQKHCMQVALFGWARYIVDDSLCVFFW